MIISPFSFYKSPHEKSDVKILPHHKNRGKFPSANLLFRRKCPEKLIAYQRDYHKHLAPSFIEEIKIHLQRENGMLFPDFSEYLQQSEIVRFARRMPKPAPKPSRKARLPKKRHHKNSIPEHIARHKPPRAHRPDLPSP